MTNDYPPIHDGALVEIIGDGEPGPIMGIRRVRVNGQDVGLQVEAPLIDPGATSADPVVVTLRLMPREVRIVGASTAEAVDQCAPVGVPVLNDDGPVYGVVEDVESLRLERDGLKAEVARAWKELAEMRGASTGPSTVERDRDELKRAIHDGLQALR